MPVGAIGEALLRGMGWKKNEAIGGKNKAYAARELSARN